MKEDNRSPKLMVKSNGPFKVIKVISPAVTVEENGIPVKVSKDRVMVSPTSRSRRESTESSPEGEPEQEQEPARERAPP